MKGGKRQENPNSHPGRDLKGQQQLSAPPSRTPKTSLLSSPHWYLSAAQTHTQEALLRVHSSLCLCLPWGVQRAGEHMGLTGATSHLRKVLHPHKAQHHPTRASKPGYLFESGQSQWAPSHTGPQDPNVLLPYNALLRHLRNLRDKPSCAKYQDTSAPSPPPANTSKMATALMDLGQPAGSIQRSGCVPLQMQGAHSQTSSGLTSCHCSRGTSSAVLCSETTT